MSRATFVETALLVVPLVVVVLAGRHGRVGERTRRVLRVAADQARRNPATVYLVAVVLAHVVFIHTLPVHLQTEVLRSRSTNLTQLQHNPLYVLVASAFWITPGGFALVALMAVFVLAPAERLFGTARWLAVFFVGHVGATLLVAAWLQIAVHDGLVGPGIGHTIDVGVSYGAYCVVFAVGPSIRSWRRRLVWFGGFTGLLAYALAVDHTFTDLGHVCAAVLGLGLWPLLRHAAGLDGRIAARWWNQPVPRVGRRVPVTG